MPSGYTSGFPTAILIDVGVLYYDKQGGDGNPTKLGVSRGGLTFDPGMEIRQPEFDGRRSGIEGLDRVTFRRGVISGTFLLEVPKHIVLLEPGIASAAGVSPVTTVYTPKAASTLFTPDTDYLQNLRLVTTRSGGTLWTVHFERALCTRWRWVGPDNDEQTVEAEFEARLLDSDAATTTDTSPYDFEVMSAIS